MPGKKRFAEIRIHGRGGQGAKSASQLIVEAAMEQGRQVQAFPEFGPERSGAPMVTYARISDKPIRTYEPVLKPDIVIVIDPTLLGQVGFGGEGWRLRGRALVFADRSSRIAARLGVSRSPLGPAGCAEDFGGDGRRLRSRALGLGRA